MSDLIKRANDAISNGAVNRELLGLLVAEIERLSKPYVPMTEDEALALLGRYEGQTVEEVHSIVSEVETATITRYNEQRGVK